MWWEGQGAGIRAGTGAGNCEGTVGSRQGKGAVIDKPFVEGGGQGQTAGRRKKGIWQESEKERNKKREEKEKFRESEKDGERRESERRKEKKKE